MTDAHPDTHPFGGTYDLHGTHSVAMVIPAMIQGVLFHHEWWWAAVFLAVLVVFAFSVRFRYLLQNTAWFLSSMLWNVAVQGTLLLIAAVFNSVWISVSGLAWVLLTRVFDSREMGKIESDLRLSRNDS